MSRGNVHKRKESPYMEIAPEIEHFSKYANMT